MGFRIGLHRIANILCVFAGVFGTIFTLLYLNYPKVKAETRTEELVFWKSVDALSAEDHSALLNHIERTGRLPRFLPWWEMDNAMCSATVVKYIVLATGIKLVHASAWTVRTERAKLIATGEDCTTCVSNADKLTTVWDETARYNADGHLAPGVKVELQDTVRQFNFEPTQVYMIGLLWEDTTYWDEVVAAGKDINSHVALWVRGRVIHFIHREAGVDPLYYETVDELFADGKLQPVWISRVHAKGKRRNLRLPKTDRELAFCQNVMPYEMLSHALVFPRRFYLTPPAYTERLDALVERSLLHWSRNGYDMYPEFVEKEETCGVL